MVLGLAGGGVEVKVVSQGVLDGGGGGGTVLYTLGVVVVSQGVLDGGGGGFEVEVVSQGVDVVALCDGGTYTYELSLTG